MNKFKINKLNFGEDNFSLIRNKVYNTFQNGTIKNISLKTFAKIFTIEAYENTASVLATSFFENSKLKTSFYEFLF